MEKKIFVVFEIVLIIGASLYYVFKEVIPEYKSSMGSSDRFIKTSEYKNMFEFNIDNNVNFALVINEAKNIYHIMFFNDKSSCLYNKNVENSSVSSGLDKVMTLLIENNYLKSSSIINLTDYGDYYRDEFKSELLKVLTKYKLNTNVVTESSTLNVKANTLKLNVSLEDEDESILRVLDNYSKEFPRIKKNSKDKNQDDDQALDDGSSKKYINNVYKKIEDYISKNNISFLEKGNTELVISMIPADNKQKYYPSNNSWYYVREGKVFAYIEIIDNDKSYSYCYNGSVDLSKKGEC